MEVGCNGKLNLSKKGFLKQLMEENSLLNQACVIDPKKKVNDIIKELNIADLKIVNFFRLKIGE